MSWSNRFRQPRGASKYGATRVKQAGYSFASKLEAATHQLLKLLEAAGEITVDQVQASVHLTDARILYKPDFKITDLSTGEPVWVEAKGFETPEWRIKKRLWEHYGPGDLQIYRSSSSGPKLTEVVKSKFKKETIPDELRKSDETSERNLDPISSTEPGSVSDHPPGSSPRRRKTRACEPESNGSSEP